MISPQTIVRGQRVRRADLTWGGVGMIAASLLLAAPVAIHSARSINWYRATPTFMLLRQANSNGPRSYLATQELLRRAANDSLSSSNVRALVDVALQAQAAPAPPTGTVTLLLFAQQQYIAGTLSEQQKQRLLQQSVRQSLRVRPRVAMGDPVPYEVPRQSRIASPWWARVSDGGVILDGKTIRDARPGSYGSMSGVGAGGSSGSQVPCNLPGVHTLQVISHIEVFSKDFGNSDPATLLYQEDRANSGTFEVIADPPPDMFKLNDDPALGEQIKASMKATGFTFNKNGNAQLQGVIEIRAIPSNVAFQITGKWNQTEHNLNFITMKEGGSVNYQIATDELETPPPSKIDLILKSDEKAARRTVDQNETWKGTIMIEGIPVAQPGDASTKVTTQTK